VKGFPGCKFAKFKTVAEANRFLNDGPVSSSGSGDSLRQIVSGAKVKISGNERNSETEVPPSKKRSAAEFVGMASATPSYPPTGMHQAKSSTVYSTNSLLRNSCSSTAGQRAELSGSGGSYVFATPGTSTAGCTIVTDSRGSTARLFLKDRAAARTGWRSPFVVADDLRGPRIPDCNIIFTDGACSNNGKSSSKAGYGVYWPHRPELNKCGPLNADWLQTNQKAELYAIQAAVEQILTHSLVGPFEIRSDSSYSVQALTDWCHRWEASQWTHPVKNLDLVRDILGVAERVVNGDDSKRIYLRHIRGHAGDPGNEAADRLAVKGSQM
jgi:ribonuclease HI